MTQKAELLGQTFGLLKVTSAAPSEPKSGKARWLCTCECGGETITLTHQLRAGRARSCGCLVKATTRDLRLKHGGSAGRTRTKEYRAWIQVRRRVRDPRSSGFKHYGAVGVTMAPAWVEDFELFLAEIGPAPSEKHTVDRIDNAKGYEPGNVRWATMKEQRRNQRRTVFIYFQGERMKLIEACEVTGVSYPTAYDHLKHGRDPFPNY